MASAFTKMASTAFMLNHKIDQSQQWRTTSSLGISPGKKLITSQVIEPD